MTTTADARTLSFWEKIGYGLGDAACNVVFQLVIMFSAYFYTDVFGLAPAAMGTLFLIVRAISSLADPVFGVICDRTETRWGKFRPYMLWLSIPLALATVLTFTTPDFSSQGKLLYAYGTFSLLMILYAAVNVPYCALGAVITPDTRERISLNALRFFLATGGGALVAATTLPLVAILGEGDERKGFQMAVATLASFAVAMLLVCFFTTRERVAPITSGIPTLWRDIWQLFQNDQWWVVAAMNFLLFVALVIQDGATVYYVTWYIGRPELISAFVTTGMVSSMLGALCTGFLAARMSKTSAYALLQAAIIMIAFALFFVSKSEVALLFVLYAAQQFCSQMASPILWSMMADTADYGEYLTGRRITGLTLSGALFSLKLGTAVGGALLGWLLADFNYQSLATSQSRGTIQGILVLFTLIPAIGHLTLIAIVRLYRLDDERCEEIRVELQRRESAAGESRSL